MIKKILIKIKKQKGEHLEALIRKIKFQSKMIVTLIK